MVGRQIVIGFVGYQSGLGKSPACKAKQYQYNQKMMCTEHECFKVLLDKRSKITFSM